MVWVHSCEYGSGQWPGIQEQGRRRCGRMSRTTGPGALPMRFTWTPPLAAIADRVVLAVCEQGLIERLLTTACRWKQAPGCGRNQIFLAACDSAQLAITLRP
jgi:hypothetical protein